MVGSIWGSLLAAGNMPPIAATSTQQCRGCTVRAWKRLPVRRLEGAECSVSLVIPSIVDGLLSSCCESDASVLCRCRRSLLGLAAWRQDPVFLPYRDGGHGDQPRRDWVCWRQLQSQAHSATMNEGRSTHCPPSSQDEAAACCGQALLPVCA